MKRTKAEGKDCRLICRPHQSGLDVSLQRKYRLYVEDDNRPREYALDQPNEPSYGVRASTGMLLERAALLKGPFLPVDVIRRYRFEGSAITDNPNEMDARYSREKEQELKRKLNRLLGRE